MIIKKRATLLRATRFFIIVVQQPIYRNHFTSSNLIYDEYQLVIIIWYKYDIYNKALSYYCNNLFNSSMDTFISSISF